MGWGKFGEWGQSVLECPAEQPHEISAAGLAFFFEGGLGGGELGDGNAEGRAAHVVKSGAVAELDGGGVAAVFAADADLEVLHGLAAAFDADLDELADAGLVEAGEGVVALMTSASW